MREHNFFALTAVLVALGCGPASPKTSSEPQQQPAASDEATGGSVKAAPNAEPEPEPEPEPTKATDAPVIVPQSALAAQRTGGHTQIQPPNSILIAIRKAGKPVIGTFKVCVGSGGTLIAVKHLRSTGYPSYDAELERGIKTWTFNPLKVNGKPVPFCSPVTFVYKPVGISTPTPTP